MSAAPSQSSRSIPYWQLKQASRAFGDAANHEDRALLVHRLLAQRANQRGLILDGHDAWLRCAAVLAARGDLRGVYRAARSAQDRHASREASAWELLARRALTRLDRLNEQSLRCAEIDPGSPETKAAHERLLHTAVKANDGELAFSALGRLAAAAAARDDPLGAQTLWMRAAELAPTAEHKDLAVKEAWRVVRASAEYFEARAASDSAAELGGSSDSDIAAHERWYVVAKSFGESTAAARAADRTRATYEMRGELRAVLDWALEAYAKEATEERQGNIGRAREDLELFAELLPALSCLNDLGAYLRVGKEHRARRQLEAARVIYLAGRAAFPDEPKLLNALAGVLRAKGARELAWAQISESLTLESTIKRNPAAHTVRGDLLCDEARFSEALALGRSLTLEHPQDWHAHRLSARAALMIDDTGLAIEHACLAEKYAAAGTDVVAWLFALQTTQRGDGAVRRRRAINTVIDHIKRLRGQNGKEGSDAMTAG